MLVESGTDPRERLLEYVSWGISGEFIVSLDSRKIRVFLQKGRVAWATDSLSERRLIHYIMGYCRLDQNTVCALFDESIQKKRHFADILVDEGFAPIDTVRLAIHGQIRDVLCSLSSIDAASTLLVPKDNFDEYRADLTFQLADGAWPSDLQASA